jgi:hypothetical protein
MHRQTPLLSLLSCLNNSHQITFIIWWSCHTTLHHAPYLSPITVASEPNASGPNRLTSSSQLDGCLSSDSVSRDLFAVTSHFLDPTRALHAIGTTGLSIQVNASPASEASIELVKACACLYEQRQHRRMPKQII